MAKKTKPAPPQPLVLPPRAGAWPADKVERRSVKDLLAYPQNPRIHSDAQIDALVRSLAEFGWTMPILVDEEGVCIAGHGRLQAANRMGIADVPVMVATGWTVEQKHAYRIADNALTEQSTWSPELLRLELGELALTGYDLKLTGFDDFKLVQYMARVSGNDPEATPELPAVPVTRRGDVWHLGKHRLMCGDSTERQDVEALMNGEASQLILTDPPYCSGGFQESNKASGSVGTEAPHKQIANDRLSSRGYSQLLKTAFSNIGAPFLYAFTDWRMWTFLFDVAETSGYGVRSMIVWNKGTPGMGRGWRSQHELVLWAAKEVAPFDKHMAGMGNVIDCSRTGNVNHTTEKPVEVIEKLLQVATFVSAVADPFCGSGTTLIACERQNRNSFNMELDAAYVDVSIRRWQDYTEKQATLEATGQTFEEVARERLAPPPRARRNKKKTTSSELQSTA